MYINTSISTVLLLFACLSAHLYIGCARHAVTVDEARLAALRRIEKVKDVFHFNPARLPPLKETTTQDDYVYEAKDIHQKVWVVVHVSKSGLAELTVLPIDEAGNPVVPR